MSESLSAASIGASLKNAGSALFALIKMELDPSVILGLLHEGEQA